MCTSQTPAVLLCTWSCLILFVMYLCVPNVFLEHFWSVVPIDIFDQGLNTTRFKWINDDQCICFHETGSCTTLFMPRNLLKKKRGAQAKQWYVLSTNCSHSFVEGRYGKQIRQGHRVIVAIGPFSEQPSERFPLDNSVLWGELDIPLCKQT